MKTVTVTKTIEVEENRATLEDLLSFLKQKDALEKATLNILQAKENQFGFDKLKLYRRPFETLLDTGRKVRSVMRVLFVWDNTPEGFEYWDKIDDSWLEWLKRNGISEYSPLEIEND